MKIPTTSLILEATLCLLLATSSVAIAAPSVLIEIEVTGGTPNDAVVVKFPTV